MNASKMFTSLGIGTSRIASLGNGISRTNALTLIKTATKNHISTIDTADTYGSGDAERLIGNALKNMRNDCFIITKAGLPHMALPALFSPLNQIGKKLYQKAGREKNYSKDYLIKSIEKSLHRLQIASVDAFLLHEPSLRNLENFPDFHEGLKFIKKKGMAKNIGISTNDLGAFKMAMQHDVVDLVQTKFPYSNTKDTVFTISKSAGIPIIVNQVLRIKGILESNEDFIKTMLQLDIDRNEIPSILIQYAHFDKGAHTVLVGSTNSKHIEQNSRAIRNKDLRYQSLFSKLDSLEL